MGTKKVNSKGTKPCFINGMDTKKGYLVLASRKGETAYNALAARIVDVNMRIHFHPNIRVFDLDGSLRALVGDYERHRDEYNKGYAPTVYDTITVSKKKLDKILGKLPAPHFTVAPVDLYYSVLKKGYTPETCIHD